MRLLTLNLFLQKTNTVTRTIHSSYTTQAVCDPGSNFDLRPFQGGFVTDANSRFGSSVHADIYDGQGCCTFVLPTPACVAFQIDPNSDAYTFPLLKTSFNENPNHHLCHH